MKIEVLGCTPENITFTCPGHKARLAGMRFKTTNLILFKITRGYWLIDELKPNYEGRDELIGYHSVLFEIEIKPFWKFNKY